MTNSTPLRVAAIGAFVVLASACTQSSTGSPTASTPSKTTVAPSLPLAPNSSAVSAFLRGSGNAILVFEQDTKPLGSGVAPTQSSCSTISRQLPSSDSSGLLSLVAQVTDPVLRYELSQDIQYKGELLAACVNGHPSTALATTARSTSVAVERRLSQLGL